MCKMYLCLNKTVLCKSIVADRQALTIAAAAATHMCTHACLYLHVFVLGLRDCVCVIVYVSSKQKHINIHKHI